MYFDIYHKKLIYLYIQGNNVKIENNCNLVSCIIDDNVIVKYKSIICEGSVLQRGCVIGPNSFVPPGRLIPA